MSEPRQVCRLYLIVPHDAGDDAARGLAAALEAGDVGCVALAGGADGHVDQALAGRLRDIAREHEVAFLVAGDVAAANAVRADGVHIAGSEAAYEEARAALGEKAIVGVECAPERHLALVLAERGADYVAFNASGGGERAREELVRWWAQIVEVPVIAWDVASQEEAGALAQAGADFIAVGAPVWRNPAGPAGAVREFGEALAQRRTAA